MERNWPMDNIWNLFSRHDIDKSSVARLAEVGSTIHGIAIEGYDDLDLIAMRFEDWNELINGPTKRQSMMIRTKPEGVRSRFDDIDIQVYTVRKFVSLAVNGNPSILTALFSPNEWHGGFGWVGWDRLIGIIPSQRSGDAFLGYMQQQMERWQGVRGQRNVSRPELVEAHGYDTKYAGHIIRLGLQGVEYMQTARLTLPMPEKDAETVLQVRRGELSEAEALALAEVVEAKLKVTIDESPLPLHPSWPAAERWLSETYDQHLRS